MLKHLFTFILFFGLLKHSNIQSGKPLDREIFELSLHAMLKKYKTHLNNISSTIDNHDQFNNFNCKFEGCLDVNIHSLNERPLSSYSIEAIQNTTHSLETRITRLIQIQIRNE